MFRNLRFRRRAQPELDTDEATWWQGLDDDAVDHLLTTSQARLLEEISLDEQQERKVSLFITWVVAADQHQRAVRRPALGGRRDRDSVLDRTRADLAHLRRRSRISLAPHLGRRSRCRLVVALRRRILPHSEGRDARSERPCVPLEPACARETRSVSLGSRHPASAARILRRRSPSACGLDKLLEASSHLGLRIAGRPRRRLLGCPLFVLRIRTGSLIGHFATSTPV